MLIIRRYSCFYEINIKLVSLPPTLPTRTDTQGIGLISTTSYQYTNCRKYKKESGTIHHGLGWPGDSWGKQRTGQPRKQKPQRWDHSDTRTPGKGVDGSCVLQQGLKWGADKYVLLPTNGRKTQLVSEQAAMYPKPCKHNRVNRFKSSPPISVLGISLTITHLK